MNRPRVIENPNEWEVDAMIAERVAFAEKTKPTAAEKLERALLHAMAMERKAGTRVKRAATTLQKWQRTRRRIENRIGANEVTKIVTRLTQAERENRS